MPNGRRYISTSRQDGNRRQERTDASLYVQDAPARIASLLATNDRGLIGDDVYFTPTTSDMLPIPHRPTKRMLNRIMRDSYQGIPSFNETMQIDAFSVSDPRGV